MEEEEEEDLKASDISWGKWNLKSKASNYLFDIERKDIFLTTKTCAMEEQDLKQNNESCHKLSNIFR